MSEVPADSMNALTAEMTLIETSWLTDLMDKYGLKCHHYLNYLTQFLV